MRGQMLYSTVGQGCWLGSLHKQGYRMGFSTAQGSLSRLSDWTGLEVIVCSWMRLASAPLPRHCCKTGSTVSMAHWLGTQVRQSSHLNSLARWDHGISSAEGHIQWLGSQMGAPVSRNEFCQDLRAGFCKFQPSCPSLSDTQW